MDENGHIRLGVILAVLCTGAVLPTLDQFVVNVAFPAIGRGLHASVAILSWVLTGYSIVFAALLIPAGRLADRNGRKSAFLLGVTLFTAASAGCAAASTPAELIAARLIQAVGAATLVPSSLSLLLAAFPEDRRGGAVRAWTAFIGASAALGPVLGGVLVAVSWRWIFLINVPIGVLAIVAGRWLLPSPKREGGPFPDLIGACMLAAAIAALSLGLVEGQSWGWNSPGTIAAFTVSAVLTGVFFRRSARHPCPVVELSLLRVRSFVISTTATIIYTAGFGCALLSLTLWVQTGWDWSPLQFGLAFAVGPLMVPLISPLGGRLQREIGAGPTIALGCGIFATSAVTRIVLFGPKPDYLTGLLPVALLTGIGVGLALPTLFSVGATALPPVRFATGSGVLNMARQLGFTIGIAVVVAILGAHPAGRDALPTFQSAWVATAALGVLAAVVGIALSRPRAIAQSLRDPLEEAA